MDYADAATSDTVASRTNLDSARQYKSESRMLRDERGQMVQLSNEWECIQHDFKLLEICGEGSFGRVVRAKHRVTKKEVAIKQIGDAFDHQYSARKVLREIQILRKLTFMRNNVFTTKIYDIVTPGFNQLAQVAEGNPKRARNSAMSQSGQYQSMSKSAVTIQQQLDDYSHVNLGNFKQIFLVMEYIESDLKKILNSVHRGTVLEEDHIVTMMYNSLCALNFIHSANLMHRDLKPGNLLVDSNCCVRLCDFGLARSEPSTFSNSKHIFRIKQDFKKEYRNKSSMSKREFDYMNEDQKNIYRGRMAAELKNYYEGGQKKRVRCLSSRIVSRWYRAPEVILTEKDYESTLDIWSMGCILAETLSCSQLQMDANLNQLGIQNDKAKRQQFITKAVKERFFFEGNSCYPISPVQGQSSKEANVVSSDDQIIVINDRYGGLNTQDKSFISNVNIMDYQNKVKADKPAQFDKVLQRKYNACSPNMVVLARDMLEYNPFFRPTAKECLQSPIFDEIRVPALERDAPDQITADIDEILPIDYDTGRIRDTEKSPEMTTKIINYFKIEILKEINVLRKLHEKN